MYRSSTATSSQLPGASGTTLYGGPLGTYLSGFTSGGSGSSVGPSSSSYLTPQTRRKHSFTSPSSSSTSSSSGHHPSHHHHHHHRNYPGGSSSSSFRLHHRTPSSFSTKSASSTSGYKPSATANTASSGSSLTSGSGLHRSASSIRPSSSLNFASSSSTSNSPAVSTPHSSTSSSSSSSYSGSGSGSGSSSGSGNDNGSGVTPTKLYQRNGTAVPTSASVSEAGSADAKYRKLYEAERADRQQLDEAVCEAVRQLIEATHAMTHEMDVLEREIDVRTSIISEAGADEEEDEHFEEEWKNYDGLKLEAARLKAENRALNRIVARKTTNK